MITLVMPSIPPETIVPEVRCPECKRLLFRGVMIGEIRCGRCGVLVKFTPPVS